MHGESIVNPIYHENILRNFANIFVMKLAERNTEKKIVNIEFIRGKISYKDGVSYILYMISLRKDKVRMG